MSNSILIRKYFSAYENKDRKAVESLLSDNFVFTSPYDYRIDRETYFKRCWPYSEQSPTYENHWIASVSFGWRNTWGTHFSGRTSMATRPRRESTISSPKPQGPKVVTTGL
jgi:hypothetical protein